GRACWSGWISTWKRKRSPRANGTFTRSGVRTCPRMADGQAGPSALRWQWGPVGATASELLRGLAGVVILLVEPDAALAEATATALTASGCIVWHAENGADARAMV